MADNDKPVYQTLWLHEFLDIPFSIKTHTFWNDYNAPDGYLVLVVADACWEHQFNHYQYKRSRKYSSSTRAMYQYGYNTVAIDNAYSDVDYDMERYIAACKKIPTYNSVFSSRMPVFTHMLSIVAGKNRPTFFGGFISSKYDLRLEKIYFSGKSVDKVKMMSLSARYYFENHFLDDLISESLSLTFGTSKDALFRSE